jgi:hypothetical protein
MNIVIKPFAFFRSSSPSTRKVWMCYPRNDRMSLRKPTEHRLVMTSPYDARAGTQSAADACAKTPLAEECALVPTSLGSTTFRSVGRGGVGYASPSAVLNKEAVHDMSALPRLYGIGSIPRSGRDTGNVDESRPVHELWTCNRSRHGGEPSTPDHHITPCEDYLGGSLRS